VAQSGGLCRLAPPFSSPGENCSASRPAMAHTQIANTRPLPAALVPPPD
jgi:hypothetical protein